jgi:heme/copper-type cytochrome/quinol oxidase subunit 2
MFVSAMIEGLVRDAVRAVKTATGANQESIVWLTVIPIMLFFALAFLSWAACVQLAEYYGAAIAGVIVGGVYFVIAAAVLVRLLIVRRRILAEAQAQAQAQLAAKASAPAWPIDPAMITIGLQIGRAIGWRRVVPLAALGLLAFGLASSRSHPADHPAE